MVTYLNPGTLEFDSVVTRSDVSGSSAFVAVPGDVKALFGTTARVPVNASFDGIPYRGSITSMGGPPLVLVLQEILGQLGKAPGDSLHVTLDLDTAPRVVDLPADVESALTDAKQLAAYRALAYSHQRQFLLWIDGAKRPETRATRIAKTVDMVSAEQRPN